MAGKIIATVLALCLVASPAYAGCGFLGLWACPHARHHHHHYRARVRTRVIVKKQIVIKRAGPKAEPGAARKEIEPGPPLPSYPPIN